MSIFRPLRVYTSTRLVDMPVVMQLLVPQVQTVLKTVQVPINQVTKHPEIPQTPYVDTMVDVPLVRQRQAPQV